MREAVIVRADLMEIEQMAEILVERDERVEVWTLNRPQALNALNRPLVDALAENLARIREEGGPRAVVLAGAGRAFCAGADLKERAELTEAEVRGFLERMRAGFRGIEESDAVFIAAIDGIALGGGAELALACDLRVASPEAWLGFPEVTLGIIPGAGGTQRLPRLIGPGRAKELILTGRRVAASEALGLGLVNRVAASGSARGEAVVLARAIGENAPLALAAAKHAIDEGQPLALDEALLLEHRFYERTLGTRDRLEGLAAFRERRPARFTGE